jgi:hypothetical protein
MMGRGFSSACRRLQQKPMRAELYITALAARLDSALDCGSLQIVQLDNKTNRLSTQPSSQASREGRPVNRLPPDDRELTDTVNYRGGRCSDMPLRTVMPSDPVLPRQRQRKSWLLPSRTYGEGRVDDDFAAARRPPHPPLSAVPPAPVRESGHPLRACRRSVPLFAAAAAWRPSAMHQVARGSGSVDAPWRQMP